MLTMISLVTCHFMFVFLFTVLFIGWLSSIMLCNYDIIRFFFFFPPCMECIKFQKRFFSLIPLTRLMIIVSNSTLLSFYCESFNFIKHILDILR